MEDPSWKKVAIIITALICSTLVVLYCLSQGIDGVLLAGYLGIIGSVVGVPVGTVLGRLRK